MAGKNVAATISIQLDAQTATLKKGFADATRSVDNLDKKMTSHVAKGMAAFTAGLMAVQAAVALVRRGITALSDTFKTLDEQQKLADKIGMSADALAALQIGADHAGSSVGTLTTSLEKMADSVTEAAVYGTGEAAKALDRLGLSAAQLSLLPLEQQLGAIADAMQGVSNQQEKMNIARDIFGRGGGDMVNVLKDGTAGLNAMSRELADTGNQLGDQRRQIEAANDAVRTMQAVWDSFLANIAIEVAPSMEKIANIFGRFIGVVRDAVDALKPFIDMSAKAWDLVTGGYYTDEPTKIVHATRHGGAFSGGIDKAREAFDPYAVAAKEAFQKAQKESEKMWKSFSDRAVSVAESLRTPAEVWRDTVAELDNLLGMGLITWETYRRGVGKVNEEIYDAQMQQYNALMEQMEKGRQSIESFSTPGVGAVTYSSAAGFSAVQSARREQADRDRKHRETIEWYARIEQAIIDSGIILEPVRL
jgi:uncharacterized phage infection (PIP) family protein YhgE